MKVDEVQSDDIALEEVNKDVVIEVGCTDEIDGRKGGKSYYHSKKSVAEGMMDISLLTANANQLRFLVFYNMKSPTFYPALILIILSLLLQVVVGFLLIFRVRNYYVENVYDFMFYVVFFMLL